jgi:hypothetical protein
MYNQSKNMQVIIDKKFQVVINYFLKRVILILFLQIKYKNLVFKILKVLISRKFPLPNKTIKLILKYKIYNL